MSDPWSLNDRGLRRVDRLGFVTTIAPEPYAYELEVADDRHALYGQT